MIDFLKGKEKSKDGSKERMELKNIEELVKPSDSSIDSLIRSSQKLITQEESKEASNLPSENPQPVTKKPMSRVPTGIPGLDPLLEGGFVPGSTILVSGEAGSGKTIFCTQFIWNALCMGENGVYITLQESPEDIKQDIMSFGRDFEVAEKRDQLRIIYAEPHDLKKLVKTITKNVKDINAKRLVIDSITLIGEEAKNVRRTLINLCRILKSLGITSLLISEVEEETKKLGRFGIEEFIVDGVILLQYMEYAAGGATRSLLIKKMRRTKHGTDVYPFEITDKGIVVKS
jgi:circadian clock protein KaiC